MKQTREQMIGLIIIVLSAAMAVLGYVLLPEVMIAQIGFDGQASNTLPKIPALLIPFAISTISSIRYMKGDPSGGAKNLVFAFLGLGIAVFSFIINYGK